MNNNMQEKESKEVAGIYRITNKVNGKFYIGSSVNIRNRWREHRTRERNTIIHQAIKKYGESSFFIEVLEECNKYELIEREQYYFDKLNPQYNMIRPIDNPMDNELARMAHRKAVQSEEKRELSRLTMKKRWEIMTEEEKEKLNQSSMTPEARAKRIATQNTEEYKKMASDHMKKVWSDPDYYKKQSAIKAEILNKVRQRPEVRSAIGSKSKERWKDKDYRDSIIAQTIAPKRKKVYLHDGEEVIEFESISSCGRWFAEKLGVKEVNAYVNVSQATRGITNGAYGYAVSLTPDVKPYIARNHKRKSKEVVMMSLNSEKIKKFESVATASLKTGCHKSGIRACCVGKYKTSGGYKWMYLEEYEKMKVTQ